MLLNLVKGALFYFASAIFWFLTLIPFAILEGIARMVDAGNYLGWFMIFCLMVFGMLFVLDDRFVTGVPNVWKGGLFMLGFATWYGLVILSYLMF